MRATPTEVDYPKHFVTGGLTRSEEWWRSIFKSYIEEKEWVEIKSKELWWGIAKIPEHERKWAWRSLEPIEGTSFWFICKFDTIAVVEWTVEKLKRMGLRSSEEGLEALGELLDEHAWEAGEFLRDFWGPLKGFLAKQKEILKFRWGKAFDLPCLVLIVTEGSDHYALEDLIYDYVESLSPRFIPMLLFFDWDIDD